MKSPKQKLKILYLMKILLEQTDEEHMLSMPRLLEELQGCGVKAERKSIYDDIEALRLFGLDVELCPGRNGGYFVANRSFQLPELQLLVDSVQASKFVTLKKTEDLIQKLESLTSVHQARALHRQVFVGKRIKSMNESVYYNVDHIHTGINQDREIAFRYFDYTVEKKKQYRRSGGEYVLSPLALIWEEEKYYLIAYDAEAARIKHYRVDKMDSIRLLDTPRQGVGSFREEELSQYSQKVFSMYGGEEHSVRMRFSNALVGVVLDRFGKEQELIPDDEGHFCITVDLQLSPQFYGWLFSLGEGVKLLSPPAAVEAFRQMALAAAD
ncbi:MAG: WYL domain-containing protein [Firmicutes bacterium]|nr:WYL domain-containing protein [Bacillota bacterium]